MKNAMNEDWHRIYNKLWELNTKLFSTLPLEELFKDIDDKKTPSINDIVPTLKEITEMNTKKFLK